MILHVQYCYSIPVTLRLVVALFDDGSISGWLLFCTTVILHW